MPRPPKRGVSRIEDQLPETLKRIRESRNRTIASLANEMTTLGYPISESAIWKIENGNPPRRVTITEILGFSICLGIDIPALLSENPIGTEAIWSDLESYCEAVEDEQEAFREYVDARSGRKAIFDSLNCTAMDPEGKRILQELVYKYYDMHTLTFELGAITLSEPAKTEPDPECTCGFVQQAELERFLKGVEDAEARLALMAQRKGANK